MRRAPDAPRCLYSPPATALCQGERIAFSHLIAGMFAGDLAKLTVLQNKVQKEVEVALSIPKKLVPVHTKGAPPSYFIVAGLVFTPCTVPYLRSEYGKEYDFDAPVKLLERMLHGQAATADQEVVVLGQVLAADINIGCEEIVNTQLDRFNGQKVDNLAAFVRMVEACTEPFLRFDLEYNQGAPPRSAGGVPLLRLRGSTRAAAGILRCRSAAARWLVSV